MPMSFCRVPKTGGPSWAQNYHSFMAQYSSSNSSHHHKVFASIFCKAVLQADQGIIEAVGMISYLTATRGPKEHQPGRDDSLQRSYLEEKEGCCEGNVLVERILDEATQTVVSKCAMDKQQPFQEAAPDVQYVRHDHDCSRPWVASHHCFGNYLLSFGDIFAKQHTAHAERPCQWADLSVQCMKKLMINAMARRAKDPPTLLSLGRDYAVVTPEDLPPFMAHFLNALSWTCHKEE